MAPQSNIIGRPVGELETPVLLVDLDKLEHNIAKVHFRRSDQWRA